LTKEKTKTKKKALFCRSFLAKNLRIHKGVGPPCGRPPGAPQRQNG